MNSTQSPSVPAEVVNDARHSSFPKSLIYGVVAALMAIYLLNPLSVIDLVPDFLPIVGNLDEATATAILLICLAHFGIELPWLRKKS